MKKPGITKPGPRKRTAIKGDMRAAYQFDYSKAQPNRFASKSKSHATVVLLSEDVAKVFKDGESVNAALRALINVVPKRRRTS